MKILYADHDGAGLLLPEGSSNEFSPEMKDCSLCYDTSRVHMSVYSHGSQ